jgi:hypothetical protein
VEEVRIVAEPLTTRIKECKYYFVLWFGSKPHKPSRSSPHKTQGTIVRKTAGGPFLCAFQESCRVISNDRFVFLSSLAHITCCHFSRLSPVLSELLSTFIFQPLTNSNMKSVCISSVLVLSMALLGEASQQQKVRGEIREKDARVLQKEEEVASDPPSDIPTMIPSDMPSDAPSMVPTTELDGSEVMTPAAAPTTGAAAEGASGAYASGLGLTLASMAFVAFL